IAAALGFTVGMLIGVRAEAQRWRANSNRIQRIESRGQLYKVITDEQYGRFLDLLWKDSDI
ncbi:MAG: hypothetical protein AAFR28_18495, partial [Pseudomonadota bacterium]